MSTETITLNGFINQTKLSSSGKHLKCILRLASGGTDRYCLLEEAGAEIPVGTKVLGGVFQYAMDPETEFKAPLPIVPWEHTDANGTVTILKFHTGFLLSAESVTAPTKTVGCLAAMLKKGIA